jgi:hypothetical protein
VLLFALTNGRAALADGFGQRAELAALALALAVCALLHAVLQRTLAPRLERYFSPVRYNERRILFDLGQEARQATDTDHLFRLIVGQIGAALQSEDASIFMRDEDTGNYVCRVSSSQATARQSAGNVADGATLPSTPLTLARDAFVVSRLRSLALPMEVGPLILKRGNASWLPLRPRNAPRGKPSSRRSRKLTRGCCCRSGAKINWWD